MGFDPTIWARRPTFWGGTVPLKMTSVPTRYGIVRTAKNPYCTEIQCNKVQKLCDKI